MKSAVEAQLFTSYSMGTGNSVVVSHHQFADDTLLLRAVLVIFEAMSGLKVNFNKSMLVGVNISSSWLSG